MRRREVQAGVSREPRGFLRKLRSLTLLYGVVIFVLGLVALAAAGGIYLFLPELRSSAITLLALGVLLVLVFLITSFRMVMAAVLGKRGKFGTNTVIVTLAFLGIVVMGNIIGARNHLRADVTAFKQFSLAPQTLRILKELPQPVEAIAFFTTSDPTLRAERQSVSDLLSEYRRHSGGKFSFRFVDPELEPGLAQQYGVKQYGTVAFIMAEGEQQRRQLATSLNEQVFTAAILQVTGKQQKKVYFLAGHNERDSLSFLDAGYGFVRRGLLADNYVVDVLNLAVGSSGSDSTAEPKVPEDAAVVVAADPQKELLEQEAKALAHYLRLGGKMMLLLEPSSPASFKDLAKKWGIGVESGTIVDKRSYALPDITAPYITQGQYNPNIVISRGLDATFFPGSTSTSSLIEKPKDTDPVQITPIAITTSESWLERDAPIDPATAKFDQGSDVQGPLVLGVIMAGVRPWDEPAGNPTVTGDKTARMVVMGDADFASNKFASSLGNADLFLNSVNWLAEEEQLISIRPKPSGVHLLVISQRQWLWILYSSVAFFPLAVALVGVLVWWRRR